MQNNKLNQISGERYFKQRLVIDGNRYADCIFVDCVFIYNGGPAYFAADCVITGSVNVECADAVNAAFAVSSTFHRCLELRNLKTKD